MAEKRTPRSPKNKLVADYRHPTIKSKMRPDVGTQTRFRRREKPRTFRYDSSLAPEMAWDGQNPAREEAEKLIQDILATDDLEKAKQAAQKLKALSRPFLNWAGKAERLSFTVPSLPLFIHEHLSTRKILETVRSHQTQLGFDFEAGLHRPIAEQISKPYQHGPWVNRLILGDSLVVMNSLLNYESLGGQVQMIYLDPPYGVKFGSNFQPFVRKRDVKPNDDADMTREPEMVQAYRDTWELGLHSYLTYLRDRLFLAREMLHPSGSIFVQISDENVHHVREIMDEVFGADNFCSLITFKKTAGAGSPSLGTEVIASISDYLLWYAKDHEHVKYNQIYVPKKTPVGEGAYTWLEFSDGARRKMTPEEREDISSIPTNARVFRADNLTSQSGVEKTKYPVEFEGRVFKPSKGVWKTSEQGMSQLLKNKRLILIGNTLSYVRYFNDFPVQAINNLWEDTVIAGFADPKNYVVQTNTKVIERCLLMTTDPGDLVLDPTCGSGTTPYAAEQWGRRWIGIDTSRVPLALARQRLLTATFPYYELQDEKQGPTAGFVYRRKQNNKGEEIGGIVPHVTLKSIANNELPQEEILVDRPETLNGLVRVCGPFCVEATIPMPLDWHTSDDRQTTLDANNSFPERLLDILRRSPILHLDGNKTVTFKNIRPPAKSLALSAEAIVENGLNKLVAFVFGPENGPVSETLVYNAVKEANTKGYTHLYVIGFAIQPDARHLIEQGEDGLGLPATYVQATLDLQMGDLLKNMRSSQIFSVAGLPEIQLHPLPDNRFQVELLGLDVFDPVEMTVDHRRGDDVPAWFLDSDYNGLCFHVSQAFFPRTSAWDNLKRALKGEFLDSVWEHLAGTISEPFSLGKHRQIAVKVIDDRGNELLVVKAVSSEQSTVSSEQ